MKPASNIMRRHIFTLNYIRNDSPDSCITLPLLVCSGFCSDKHPTVALVPPEVWEEDGGFLRNHSENPDCLYFVCLIYFHSDCHLVD